MQKRQKFLEKQKEEFEVKVLDLKRVARMTAGGRRFRFRAVVVVGDKKGRVGVAIGKGQDTVEAVEQATRLAKKNLISVNLSPTGTIWHETEAKFGAAKVLLKPQIKGMGLVAGGVVRTICQMAGIQDISAKVLGATRNKLNNALAVIKALKKIKPKKES